MSFPLITSDTSSSGFSAVYFIDQSSRKVFVYYSQNNPEVAGTGEDIKYATGGPAITPVGTTTPITATSIVALGFLYKGTNYSRIFYVDAATSTLSELLLDKEASTNLPAPKSNEWNVGELQKNQIKVATGSPITAHLVEFADGTAPQMKVFYYPSTATPNGNLSQLAVTFINIPGDNAGSWKKNVQIA